MNYLELPAIQLPLLVHAAISGDESPALPVAAGCTLLYLGADLLDNLIDDELPPAWQAHQPAEALLAATTLLAAGPELALARLHSERTSETKRLALTRLFAETLLTMSAGEHEDLLLTGRDNVGAEKCRNMVEHKSGSEFALFASAGATLATENATVIGHYAAFGKCLGTARQLFSDLLDIWKDGDGRDLTNGKRTLPIVHALSALRGRQHKRLLELLEAARRGDERYDEIRRILLETGSAHYTALVVEDYLRRASSHLAEARPLVSAERELQGMIRGTSLVPASKDSPL